MDEFKQNEGKLFSESLLVGKMLKERTSNWDSDDEEGEAVASKPVKQIAALPVSAVPSSQSMDEEGFKVPGAKKRDRATMERQTKEM